MRRRQEKSIKKTAARAVITVLLVMAVIFPTVTLAGIHFVRRRQDEYVDVKMSVFADASDMQSETLAGEGAHYDAHLKLHLLMMTDTLAEFVTPEGYTGPRVLSDGFVVELQGDWVLLPEGAPEGETDLSRELIEQSVAEGAVRTGHLRKKAVEGPSGDKTPAMSYDLSFGRIAEDLYYVDMISEEELWQYLEIYSSLNYDALEKASQVFEGSTLVLSEQEGGIELIRAYGDMAQFETLADLGLTGELILEKPAVLTVNGTSYSCAYSELEQEAEEGTQKVLMVQMLPVVSLGYSNINRALAIGYAMVLIFAAAIIFVIAVLHSVRETVLTREQARRYSPRNLAVRLISAAVAGAVAVFIVAFVTYGMANLYTEIEYGKDTLQTVQRYVDQQTVTLDTFEASEQEQWYVYYGEQMASLFSREPVLATKERLQRYCDILDIEFIMLFDENGKQTLCNKDYSGFTLRRGVGDNTGDFERLLMGVGSIVHPASVDPVTGLELQMIGISLPLSDGSGGHGALIMALEPDYSRGMSASQSIDRQMSMIGRNGDLCFAADASSGVVVYSGDEEMTYGLIGEWGLPENSLQDGYMDFDVIGDERYFVTTSRDGDYIFYRATRMDRMFAPVLRCGGISVLLYALGMAILLTVLMKGYDAATWSEWAVVEGENDGEEDVQAVNERRRQRREEQAARRERLEVRSGTHRARLSRVFDAVTHWRQKQPEEKVSLVLRIGVVLLVVAWVSLLLRNGLISRGFDSMAGFLLQGDWQRGFNIFAICSSFLIVAIVYIVDMVSFWFLKLVSGFMLGKGKTYCKLIYSAIKYMALFVALYFMLRYFGFPIGTVVGSIGIVSLALSLGARDMAADILAGLGFVFEKDFQVGDTVQIGDVKGEVLEIGVRATRILTGEENVVTLNNHQINAVVNMSNRPTLLSISIKVAADSPMDKVEEVIRRELPRISRECPGLLGDVSYDGVGSFNSPNGRFVPASITLDFSARCPQGSVYAVRSFVTCELVMALRSEGVAIC